jgi:hypothetical protein
MLQWACCDCSCTHSFDSLVERVLYCPAAHLIESQLETPARPVQDGICLWNAAVRACLLGHGQLYRDVGRAHVDVCCVSVFLTHTHVCAAVAAVYCVNVMCSPCKFSFECVHVRCRRVIPLCTYVLDPSDKNLLLLGHKRAREGLVQPQVCLAGDVSPAPCLPLAAGELAAAARLRQARSLSACIRFLAIR